ncbi:D-alanyl-D-alanine carboxypeptidase [Bacillus badius]|uniref:serine-type D-Ala-D-Ala carboxypeptidase n=1 Tax=Bacillus badius TaxID=1455 RepID=A0ABR5ANS1_BACBA|nr:serine hydrolase [Bacillus badius]KIL71875.1 D-alanyl-D-alanine carboxypeptidase [Bacillus badius]KIL72686.1 D-alanyl-D-alanine carboxypeptidase [Bacillus badius]MED4718426.1 serine hydrolase [Bacillus badius]
MRNQIFKKGIAFMLSLLLVASLFQPLSSVQAEESFKVNAAAAILVDSETGQILYEQNADQMLGIASMTKMMTEYLLLEAIKEKKVSWDQEYTVSDYVYKVSQDRNLSNVPLRLGEKYNVRELYEAMTIYSANAATIALAETIAGSEAEFVKLMNKKAKELGLEKYKFVNASGLSNKDLKGMHPSPGKPEDENMMSAKTTATLAFHLVKEYPEVLETASVTKKKFREGTDDETNMENWNWMLPSLVFGYEGMTGLKTGSTDFAGYCFTGTAERDGKKFISVAMNATDEKGKGNPKARFTETKKLLDYGFNQLDRTEVIKKGATVKGYESAPVAKGKEKQVAIRAGKELAVYTKKGEKPNYKINLDLKGSEIGGVEKLKAPLKKDKVVGFVTLTPQNGSELKYIADGERKQAAVPMETAEKVEKANWFVLSMRAVGGFFSGIWTALTDTVTGWF